MSTTRIRIRIIGIALIVLSLLTLQTMMMTMRRTYGQESFLSGFIKPTQEQLVEIQEIIQHMEQALRQTYTNGSWSTEQLGHLLESRIQLTSFATESFSEIWVINETPWSSESPSGTIFTKEFLLEMVIKWTSIKRERGMESGELTYQGEFSSLVYMEALAKVLREGPPREQPMIPN